MPRNRTGWVYGMCRGEHCSPVRFSRTIVFLVWLRGRSMTAPTSQPILFIIVYGRGRGIPRPCGIYLYKQATAKQQGGVKTPPYITLNSKTSGVPPTGYTACFVYNSAAGGRSCSSPGWERISITLLYKTFPCAIKLFLTISATSLSGIASSSRNTSPPSSPMVHTTA